MFIPATMDALKATVGSLGAFSTYLKSQFGFPGTMTPSFSSPLKAAIAGESGTDDGLTGIKGGKENVPVVAKKAAKKKGGARRRGPAKRGVRDAINFRKNIRKNSRYKNMRGDVDRIVDVIVRTTHCPSCNVQFLSPRKTSQVSDAIDHDHEMEKSSQNCFRARLCVRCNTSEGRLRTPKRWARFVHCGSPSSVQVKRARDIKNAAKDGTALTAEWVTGPRNLF